MNLVRFVEGIGLKAVLCGNMKGLYAPYRNPTTQASLEASGVRIQCCIGATNGSSHDTGSN